VWNRGQWAKQVPDLARLPYTEKRRHGEAEATGQSWSNRQKAEAALTAVVEVDPSKRKLRWKVTKPIVPVPRSEVTNVYVPAAAAKRRPLVLFIVIWCKACVGTPINKAWWEL